MEEKIPEIEKSIQDQILDKMISKLKANSFDDGFLEKLKETDLTKPVALKEILTKLDKNEDSKTGN